MGCFVTINMVDPLIQNPSYDEDIDPIEAEKTLLNFLGQTYSEISRYDSHLVSANPFLAPKKQEFQRTAERVLQETRQGSQAQYNPQQLVQQPTQQLDPRPYIDTNRSPVIPSTSDPNQLEFSFDNSVTAKSINSKLEDIEKRLKRLDTTLSKVLSYFESHEIENPKQE